MELTDAYSILSFVYRSLFANYTVLQETVKLEITSRKNESLRAVTFLSIINQLEICKAFISEMYPYPRI